MSGTAALDSAELGGEFIQAVAHQPATSHDTAANLRFGRTQAFTTWADVTGGAMAA